jgi:hypothetical protein
MQLRLSRACAVVVVVREDIYVILWKLGLDS